MSYHPGLKNHSNSAGWYAPVSLLHMGDFPQKLEDYTPDPNTTTPRGGRVLQEHQARAVTFLRLVDEQREGAILAAKPGLCKTTSSLHALHLDGFLDEPGLVCGPLMSLSTWCGEDSDPYRYYGKDIHRLTGTNPKEDELQKFRAAGATCFVNYEILDAWRIWICSLLRPSWVVFDECHLLMKGHTHRSEAARNLSMWHTIRRRYGLTGSPLPKYRMDLWHQLAVVQPRQWDTNKHRFGMRYCAGRSETLDDGSSIYTYDGESHDDELRSRLGGSFLRYTAKEAGETLPEVVRNIHRIERRDSPEWDEYRKAARNVAEYLKDSGDLHIGNEVVYDEDLGEIAINRKGGSKEAVVVRGLTALIGLLSVCKRQDALKLAIDMLSRHTHVVVFTGRKDTSNWLCTNLLLNGAHAHGPVDGTMKPAKRFALAEDFSREREKAIYIATVGSAGMSLNDLVCASGMLFVDLQWNPDMLLQPEGRIVRMGSRHNKVEIYYIVASGTVDDLYIDKLLAKVSASESLTPGDSVGAGLLLDLSIDREKSHLEPADLDAICSLLSESSDYGA